MIEMSEDLRARYPGAVIGALVMRNAAQISPSPRLDELCRTIESTLRDRYGARGKDAVRAEPVMAAYDAYYRQFRKTYHVSLQLDSVIWKGRSIESPRPVVKLMFAAELKNMLLTAAHDLACVSLPVRAGVAAGNERFVALGGEEKALKEGDMMIEDSRGVISSVIAGPDQRTAVTGETRDLLFAVYAPAGIGEARVRSHLEDIRGYAALLAPGATCELLEALTAG